MTRHSGLRPVTGATFNQGQEERTPRCPECGFLPTLRHEPLGTEQQPFRQAPPLVVFLSAFLLLGLYAFLVLSTYLLYPTLLMILAAGAALWARWFQPPRKKDPPAHQVWHCPRCGLDFTATTQSPPFEQDEAP